MDQSIVSKIAKATLAVGGQMIADKRNREQNYDYVSSDKILTFCGQALANVGLAVIPEILSQKIATINRPNDKFRFDAEVEFAFHITDGDKEIISKWFGCGSDYAVPDKALYKAITSGHKYFLAKLFCVGAGNEDPEHETDEEEGQRKPAQKPAPAQPASGNGHEKATETVAYPIGSLEWAQEMRGSKKERYGDLFLGDIENRLHSMEKYAQENELTPEKSEEYRVKRQALNILKAHLEKQSQVA